MLILHPVSGADGGEGERRRTPETVTNQRKLFPQNNTDTFD